MNNDNYVIQSDHFEVSLDSDNLTIVADKLNIPYGKFIIIEGENGVGKSTLLKFLANTSPYYFRLASGSLNIYGLDMEELKKDDALQRKITYIGQDDHFERGSSIYHSLVSMTLTAINNDKEYSSKKKEFKKLTKDIAFAYYKDIVHKFVHKKENNLFKEHPESDMSFMFFKRTSSLSGGQQKIIHILQGFIKTQVLGIHLLLLDEPLNNLDKENKKYLLSLISELRKKDPKLTILTITHCRVFPNIDGRICLTQNTEGISEVFYEDVKYFSFYHCLK